MADCRGYRPGSARRLGGLFLCGCLLAAATVTATDYYVAVDGDDNAAGTGAQPWATINHAAAVVIAGDVVHVLAGTYVQTARFTSPGQPGAPIRFQAEGTVLVDADGEDWGLFVDGYEDNEGRWVELVGFSVTGAARGGIRVSWAEHVTIRNCRCRDNGRWGIFTDFSDDLLIENNICHHNQAEHGIYVSNSGDRPVVRGNYCYENHASGIQLNADPQMGGDGIITGALIEKNICLRNGFAGGAAINLASVRDSIIRNNLLAWNLAGGIACWGDGNGPDWGCKNDRFIGNTICFAADEGRWCISLKEASIDAVIADNVLIGGDSGALEYSPDSMNGLQSDYNILYSQTGPAVVTEEDAAFYDFDEWQAAGWDGHSMEASPELIFLDPATDDFHQRSGSPAIDSGTHLADGVTLDDLEGLPRRDDPDTPNQGPQGGFYDMGCHEYQPGVTPTPVPGEVTVMLLMPAHRFSPGDTCALAAELTNTGSTATGPLCLAVVLDVYGDYFLWDGANWGEYLECVAQELSGGETRTIPIIDSFTWPPCSGGLDGLRFWSAVAVPDWTALASSLAWWDFGYECQ
ncbi:right-handed parallel beta-helix repeat-containing protein [bacterium]|nr:right-handed parallel beta-helix repeat-containing protein [candidate division CSSED10-310 bacterium]